MKRIHSVAIALALAMLPLALARAGSKPVSPAANQARALLEQIDMNAVEIADVAQKLGESSKDAGDPRAQLGGLDTLRSDVNSIGSAITVLDAERSSLTQWEVEALDRTTALMLDVAARTEQAIQTFNDGRTHLFASGYAAEIAKASSEADEVRSMISGYLKLARARDEENRLEHSMKVVPQG